MQAPKQTTKYDDDSEFLTRLTDYQEYLKYQKIQDNINFLSKEVTDKLYDENTKISLKLMSLRYNGQPDIWKPDKFAITTIKGPKIEVK